MAVFSFWVLPFAFLLALVALARWVRKKVQDALKKAGVQLTWGALSSRSLQSLSLRLAHGPIQRLSIDSIAWGSAASAGNSSHGPHNSASTQLDATSAWLPIFISGVQLVVAAGGSKKVAKRVNRKHKKPGAVRTAAASWPIGGLLRLLKKLLPHAPLRLQDVRVELEAAGLSLQLGRAALQWAVQEEHSLLTVKLLLQDMLAVAGNGRSTAGDVSASIRCFSVHLSAGIAASK
eukprot:gene10873-11027_t